MKLSVEICDFIILKLYIKSFIFILQKWTEIESGKFHRKKDRNAFAFSQIGATSFCRLGISSTASKDNLHALLNPKQFCLGHPAKS